MKSVRILNGYRVIFQPEHPTSMKTGTGMFTNISIS